VGGGTHFLGEEGQLIHGGAAGYSGKNRGGINGTLKVL